MEIGFARAETLDEFRARIALMSDEVLIEQGLSYRRLVIAPNGTRTVVPGERPFQDRWIACRQEWRRRHPKPNTNSSETA